MLKSKRLNINFNICLKRSVNEVDKVYSTQRVSDEYISVNTCGEQILDNSDYDTLRPNGRIDFGIQYIESGRCTFEDDGEERVAEAGSLILHFPNVKQHYSFKKEDATHLCWVHFSGSACNMLDPIKTDKTVLVKISDTKEFNRIFHMMIKTSYALKPYYETVRRGFLLSILGIILRDATGLSRSKSGHLNGGLEKVISYININFHDPVALDKYADMCYVSKSRFLHMFKDYTGFSPYRYQLNVRIERSIELLAYTSMSVAECSSAVGFKDCSYFCRIFKKYTGKTPMYYRKQNN